MNSTDKKNFVSLLGAKLWRKEKIKLTRGDYLMLRLLLTLTLGAISLVFLAYTSNAAKASFVTLLAEKDWQNGETQDALLQTTVCKASTQTSDSTEAVELALSYPKDGRLLPIITLRSKILAPMISIKTSSRESEPMFLLQAAASPEETNLYWYAPINFAALEKLIRAKNTLELFFDPKGSPVPVKISLSGSANALDAVKKCVTSKESPADFFASLNKEKDALVPDLGDRTPAFLQSSTQAAYAAYRAGLSLNSEIEILRKPFAPLIKKENAALAERDSAIRRTTKAQEVLDAARNLVTSLESGIATAKADLAQLKEQKPLAEQDLAAKRAIYLPLKEQMVAQEKRVDLAEKAVKKIESEISRNEGIISRNTRQIRALENERSNLQQAIPGLERDLRSLESQLSDAESNYNRYNPSSEKERFLNNDSSYSWAKRDLQSKESDLQRAESEYRNAESRANDARRSLDSCRSQPEPNCSSEESAVWSAERERDTARSRESSIRSDISSLESKIRSAESEAESKARSEHDRLRQIRDGFSSDVSSKRSTIYSYRSRIEDIRSEIPVLKRQIENARNALPGLNQDLIAAQATLAQTIQERNDFSKAIGFDVAEKNFTEATTRLSEINKGIVGRTKEIPSLEKKLVSAKKAVDPAVKDLAKNQERLDKSQAALALIQNQLTPLREQEAGLMARLTVENEKFKLNRAIYQDLYRELANR